MKKTGETVLAIKRFSLRSEYIHAVDDTMNKAGFFAQPGKLQVNYEIHRLETGGSEKSGLLVQFQAGF